MAATAQLPEYKTYIDGKWVSAASGKTFETSDPYTGEPWARIPECDKADVDLAVEAAARAFESGPWPQLGATARGKVLRRIAGLIEKHADHLGRIETRDNGKLISEMSAQTKYLPEWFYYYGGLADKICGSVCRSTGRTTLITSCGNRSAYALSSRHGILRSC